MKKLVFMFICLVAMTFAACGKQTNGSASQNDTDTTVTADSVDSAVVDSVK